jgi:quercetin dioxygenase-like cupin family protein
LLLQFILNNNNNKVKKMKNKISIAAFLLLGSITVAHADTTQTQSAYSISYPSKITWVEGPNALPAKARVAVLAGDPKSSGPFTIRLKLPAHYQIPAHSHPSLEQVTVISGDFHIGSGDTFTTKGDTLHAGGFVVVQPNQHHFAWTNSGAVIQLNGVGPWDIHYVDSKNDPRNAKQ